MEKIRKVMEKKTLLFIGIGVVVIAGGLFALKDKIFKMTIDEDNASKELSNARAGTKMGSAKFPLKFGDKNTIIKEMQILLNSVLKAYGKSGRLVTDGILGSKTEKVLKVLDVSVPVTQSAFTKVVVKAQELINKKNSK